MTKHKIKSVPKVAQVAKVDSELGIVFGYAIICTKNGEKYFDTQGDHIPESSMLKAVAKYADGPRLAKDMHEGESIGTVIFTFPLTSDIAKALEIDVAKTGLIIGMKPQDDAVLAKYKSGEYTGFSIGGYRVLDEDLDEEVNKSADSKVNKELKRRVMKDFEISEISAVDMPAQAEAQAQVIKNNGKVNDLVKTNSAILTSVADGHTHLVLLEEGNGTLNSGHTYSNCDDHNYHQHPWVRNDDGSITVGEADGHTHEITQLEGNNDMSKFDSNSKASTPAGAESEVNKQLKDRDDKIAALEAKLAKNEALAGLNAVERAHYDTLGEDAKSGFLSKSREDRMQDISKASERNEVVYTDIEGTEYTKSDDPRMVSLAKRNDELIKKSRADQLELEKAELRKRVESDFSHLPGTIEDNMEMLKAIESIPDEEVRKRSIESLKAQNSAMTKVYTTVGTSAQPTETSAQGKLEKMAKDHAEKHSTTYEIAYSKVLTTTAGRELYAEMAKQ